MWEGLISVITVNKTVWLQMICFSPFSDDIPENPYPIISNQPLGHPLQEDVVNAASPICSPPAASVAQVKPDSASPQKCNGHHHHSHSQPHKKRLPSAAKSQHSLKTNAAQIQEVAGDGRFIVSEWGVRVWHNLRLRKCMKKDRKEDENENVHPISQFYVDLNDFLTPI